MHFKHVVSRNVNDNHNCIEIDVVQQCCWVVGILFFSAFAQSNV